MATAPTLEESIARLKQEAGSYDPADLTGTDLSTTDSIKRLTKWLGKKKPAVIILDSCSISDKGSVLLGTCHVSLAASCTVCSACACE
jgi:pyridoxal/pyridoxine/pyridoxamine kinase